MRRISREEALDIAKNNIGTLFNIEITDKWNAGWVVYGAERLADCWYITFSPSLTGTSTGRTYLLAISKENGSVLHSGAISDAPSIDKSTPVSGVRETGRDCRFIAYDDGTVLDTNTNLMWAAKDNGKKIYWANAKRYCENYRGCGYTDWRMPTLDELAGLYDKTKTYRSVCGDDVHLTELIRLTCFCAWASETRYSEAAGFNFYYGEQYWGRRSGGSDTRALPVRSGK